MECLYDWKVIQVNTLEGKVQTLEGNVECLTMSFFCDFSIAN